MQSSALNRPVMKLSYSDAFVSLDVKVVVGLELGRLLVVVGLQDLQILSLDHVSDQVVNLLALDHLRVNEEEFHVH